MLTDAVSGCAGQGDARHPPDLSSKHQAFPDPESFLRLKSRYTIIMTILLTRNHNSLLDRSPKAPPVLY
jgi:hypothetical protein